MLLSSQSANLEALWAYFSTVLCSWISASSRLGALNIVRISDATSRFMLCRGTYWLAFCCKWNWQRCHGTPLNTALRAACSPTWASLMTNSTPFRPLSTRLCRKSRQCSSCSPSETDAPRIKRLPSRFTPLAIRTAASRICPSSRTFSYKASRYK